MRYGAVKVVNAGPVAVLLRVGQLFVLTLLYMEIVYALVLVDRPSCVAMIGVSAYVHPLKIRHVNLHVSRLNERGDFDVR